MQKKITLNSNLSKKPKNLLTEGTKKKVDQIKRNKHG